MDLDGWIDWLSDQAEGSKRTLPVPINLVTKVTGLLLLLAACRAFLFATSFSFANSFNTVFFQCGENITKGVPRVQLGSSQSRISVHLVLFLVPFLLFLAGLFQLKVEFIKVCVMHYSDLVAAIDATRSARWADTYVINNEQNRRHPDFSAVVGMK